jgi:hypothetical protein
MIAIGPRLGSNEQRPFRIERRFRPMVLNASLPLRSEKIETQAVMFQVCEPQEVCPEGDPLIVGQEAFKDGVLHALAVVQAGFGDVAEATLAIGRRGGDIVADEDHHRRMDWPRLSPLERRVGVEIAAEVAGEQEGLGVKEQADGNFFTEKRMLDLLLLPLLPRGEDFFPPVVGKKDGAGFGGAEVLRLNLLAIDQRQREAVGERSAEFLDQVEGEAGATGAIAMQKADGGI